MQAARRTHQEPINSTGLCACGCGETTPIARTNRADRGYQKGQHVTYVLGHQVKAGAENHKWRGGRHIHKTGYVYVSRPDHPSANRDGYVLEHRAVMEESLGRLLDRKETVHHINRDRGDNRIENLLLFSDHDTHVREHHSHDLANWHKANPEKSTAQKRAAGKKGAEARWKKR